PEITVRGLSHRDAAALLATVVRGPLDERVRDRIIAETHGNPLALLEWPRGLSASDLAGGFGLPALPVAGRLEEGFRRRLEELPPGARRFVIVAAAEPTGDAMLVWRAAGQMGVGSDDVSAAVESGLMEIGARMFFRHPLVRSAAYQAASLDDRRTAHGALAEVTDATTDPDLRAWHLALAARAPHEDVAAELERCAGRAQARGGLAAMAALLERSAALTPDPRRRAQRTLAAADAHLEAGSFDAAAKLLASAELTVLDDVELAQLDLLRARHAYVGGALRDAPSLLLRAAKRLEPFDVVSASATYLLAMGASCVAGGFAREVTIQDVARAARLCPTPDVPPPTEPLRTGLAQATVEGAAAATAALRRALEVTSSDGSGPDAFLWLGYRAAAATVLWDIDAVHRLSVLQVDAARGVGALTWLPWALNALAHVLTLEGELEHAESLVIETNQIVEATGSNQVPWAGALLAAWRGGRGSHRAIDDLVARAGERSDAFALKNALWASAILHNGMRRFEEALIVARQADEQPWEWGSHLYFHELIEAAVRSGHIAAAEAELERLGEMVSVTNSDWGLGLHVRSRALLSDGAEAEELYREAVERLERSPVRPEAARAHLLYGEWLRQQGRRADARQHLRAAYEQMSAIGIEAFAERARHELVATGDTVRKRSIDTFDELTPQELQIARLAAEGRSNPEIGSELFISARTVEWHLRKVFTKIGVTSRNQLRERLARSG
ncbi:MAG TPA: LuxR C-terminal-related transcriptional regulator, partial [Acidimicrobiales bacterium]|nr:LuxR C-terminal-related transcriptional regulator [Acidimicrobiales bacterium]